MLDVNLGALPSLGWDGRALTLFSKIAHRGLVPGRVVRVERTACVVALPKGDRVVPAPSGVAVGDWVAVRVDDGDPEVMAIAERWSELARWSPAGRIQVLAANVDLVLITAPADRLSPARVERETAMSWDSGGRPVVLVTKSDLAAEGEVTRLAARLGGVDVVATSTVTGAGLDDVRALLQPCQTAVLIGPSGAGKSSLANALIGSERLATGAVRQGDQRGRHTTTSRQLVAVPSGGVLIDTPGLRSLALTGDGGGVHAAFDDIEKLAAGCRFRDCHHDREPGCAVLAAASRGDLNVARLTSYKKLTGEVSPQTRQDAPRHPPTPVRSMRGQPKKH